MQKLRALVSVFVGLLLAGAVFIGAVSLVFTAADHARRGEAISQEDAEALTRDLDRLQRVWKKGGALGDLQNEVKRADDEIRATLLDLRKAGGQEKVADRLESIAAHLAVLRKMMEIEETENAAIVNRMTAQVAKLKTGASEHGVAALFRELAKLFLKIWIPLSVAALAVYLLLSRKAQTQLRSLFRGFKSVEFGPAKIELAESREAKANAEATFGAYRHEATTSFDLGVQHYDVIEKTYKVIDALRTKLATLYPAQPNPLSEYRCTIHVPDIVLAATLYQLLDYLPDGSGRGRVFSVRFGLIGKVWRRWRSELQDVLPTGPTAEDTLVTEWGMTPQEARLAARSRPSFFGVPLEWQTTRVGVFYMDSTNSAAFGRPADADQIATCVRTACNTFHLTEALFKIKDDLSGASPLIEVHKR